MSLAGYSPWGCKGVGHALVTEPHGNMWSINVRQRSQEYEMERGESHKSMIFGELDLSSYTVHKN